MVLPVVSLLHRPAREWTQVAQEPPSMMHLDPRSGVAPTTAPPPAEHDVSVVGCSAVDEVHPRGVLGVEDDGVGAFGGPRAGEHGPGSPSVAPFIASHETVLAAAARPRTSAALTSSIADGLPPSAVPARRFKGHYDGTMHLPPGVTKRALGRMRMVWCCVVTSESWHALFVGVPILFFATLFASVVVPRGEWYTYVFTAIFTAASLTCLTLSVTLDPGIIPPAPQSEQPENPTTVMVGGKAVECKVCTTCHIIRPPRSSHCRFCDVCVEEFDHHCGILGSCVGKRTFRFFGGFFIITSVLALYVFFRSLVVIVTTDFKRAPEERELIWLAVACLLCIFAAFLGGILVMPCAGRYILLSATNSTVKETMNAQTPAQAGDSPAGCVPVAEMNSDNYALNFLRRLFSPIGRSRIPLDYYV
ncbi:DHHC palmitoyltransferase [Novymonas esmeraldas]|uniref:Palmitoyltransferase n=1 Tax=Novymonas esmeraldas TaxID=1808958 RepID=A0AAW0ENV0_9TRYP